MSTDPTTPVVIVSNDTHIGPRLVEDLRPYCPREHLDEFDRFAADATASKEAATAMLQGSGYLDHPNFRTLGHHDSAARLADYDHDGIAAGVMFHGSMNLEPIPFIAQELGKPTSYGDHELVGVGMRDLQPVARGLRVAGTAPPHRARLPPDVGRRRGGRRGRVGARRRAAGRQLPCDARRRAARVQPQALGAAVVGLRGPPHAARHPRRRRPPTPATRGSRAWPSCRSNPAGSRRAGRCGGSSSPASSSGTPASSS